MAPRRKIQVFWKSAGLVALESRDAQFPGGMHFEHGVEPGHFEQAGNLRLDVAEMNPTSRTSDCFMGANEASYVRGIQQCCPCEVNQNSRVSILHQSIDPAFQGTVVRIEQGSFNREHCHALKDTLFDHIHRRSEQH
jgi:hypothetical protein